MDQTPTRLSWTESRWVLNSPSLWHLTFSSPLSSLSKTEGDSDIEWGCLWHSNVPCAINGFTNSCVLQDMYKLYFYNHLSLYIYIILYIDTCLSLSVFSLVSMTKPKSHKTSPFRPLRLEAMACTLASSKSCRASAGLARACGFQGNTTCHNIHQHIDTHRNWRSLSCQHFASRQRPLVFIFQLFILEGFGASVGTHSKPVYRDAWAHWGGYKDDRAALMHTASGSTALSSTSNLLNRFPKIVDWIWCMCGRPEEML